MSDSSPQRGRWLVVAGAVVGLLVAGLAAWQLAGGAGSEAASGARGRSQPGFSAFEDGPDQPDRLDQADQAVEPDTPDEADAAVRAPAARSPGKIMRPEPGVLGPLHHPPDAGADVAETERWDDPVNRQVLGHKQWMAELPDAQAQAIEEELDRPRPQPYPYDLQVRRSGIDVAKAIVGGCFERLERRNPAARGRVIVAFDLVATGTRGVFRDVSIPSNFRLKDPRFEQCILTKLASASFATAEEGVMRVEYPFFFDDTDPARP